VDRVKLQLQAGRGQAPPPPAPKLKPAAAQDPLTCPHCNARFEQHLKFCGECGKPMKAVRA
jgi:predicted amidophosphoribosyltransferase